MPRRPRCRPPAVLKWTGAGLCALIFAAWFASRWVGAFVSHQRSDVVWSVWVQRGVISAGRSQSSLFASRPQGWMLSYGKNPAGVGWDWGINGVAGSSEGMRGVAGVVPFYIPFAMLAAPTGWLFHIDRRSKRWAGMGRCAKCGYSLSGLPPGGACPECGKGAA